MSEQVFVALCKKEVVEYANKVLGEKITEDNVYVVWLCKTLQNNKALLSTNLLDGMYYEITHNGNDGVLYVDAYKKVDNYTVVV